MKQEFPLKLDNNKNQSNQSINIVSWKPTQTFYLPWELSELLLKMTLHHLCLTRDDLLDFIAIRVKLSSYGNLNSILTSSKLLKKALYMPQNIHLKTVNTTGPEGIRRHSEVTNRWLSH